MPIYVTVYHLDRMIVGKTEGEVKLGDLDGYFDAVIKARAIGYRKIFDATGGTSALTAADVDAFRKRMQSFVARGNGRVGPFAVVAGPQRHERLADICRTVASADRPMRIFSDIFAARQWLAAQDDAAAADSSTAA
ncbi:MAG: hypothetical protein KIT25_04030 [Enhydrobacter sp.]|nr:MAG: hypothetical protein KIT25_04030 [Enhydrobacter sp.]